MGFLVYRTVCTRFGQQSSSASPTYCLYRGSTSKNKISATRRHAHTPAGYDTVSINVPEENRRRNTMHVDSQHRLRISCSFASFLHLGQSVGRRSPL